VTAALEDAQDGGSWFSQPREEGICRLLATGSG